MGQKQGEKLGPVKTFNKSSANTERSTPWPTAAPGAINHVRYIGESPVFLGVPRRTRWKVLRNFQLSRLRVGLAAVPLRPLMRLAGPRPQSDGEERDRLFKEHGIQRLALVKWGHDKEP
jgi:hypothetical protein